MCGIVGLVGHPGAAAPSAATLRAMCDSILHRGPDDQGSHIAGPVALGMRRLSIIDVAGGHQPVFNEDGSVYTVFNGEIYNYRDLRAELEARGHRFATSSDTEVIVHLWEEHGTDFARRLNGMFAIALHDTRQGKVVLARDRLGIKPLYYAIDRDGLVFGSEVKALLASGRVDREIDLDALGQFMAWEYVPAPQTLLRAVRKLEPAHLIEIDLADWRIAQRRFWDIPVSNGHAALSPAEWEAAVDTGLREAVRRQMVSDVPLGAFLSGGVDSSLVVAAMGEARTFSIGFDDPSYNELGWSARVAEHLKVDHRTEIIRPDAVALFDQLMHFMDDPIGDFSIFPTFLVSRLARRDVTVSLSGDGGDELFGGYETYLAQDMARLWRRVPAFLGHGVVRPLAARLKPRPQKKGLVNKVKRFVEGATQDPRLGHARWRLFVDEAMRRSLFTPEAGARMTSPVEAHILRLFDRAGSRSELDRALYVDVGSYLSDNCLVKVDRMSMACSLEARVPFLDNEVIDLAFALPAELKVDRGRTKVLLKRIAARHVPRDCVYRPKEGFSIPIKDWLKGAFRPLMEELLAPSRLAAEGVFEPATVDRLKTEHLEGRANHSHVLWSLLVFQDWRRRWAA